MKKSELKLDDIFDMAWNWRLPALLMQAHTAGLFDAAQGGWKEAEDIARLLEADKRATYLLLLGLAGMGLMEKSKTRFRNSELVERSLVRSSPDYRGHILSLATRQAENWFRIPEVLKSGRPVAKPEMNSQEAEAWHKTFIMAMDDIARQYSHRIIDALPVQNGMNIMDIGAGPGRHMIELLKKFPDTKTTAFDRPASRGTVLGLAGKEGVADRMTFIGGDLTVDSFGEEAYDGILISNVLRIVGPDKAAGLFKRVARALKPGGFLAINEIPIGPDDDIGPGAVFAVQIMLGTAEGDIHTNADICGWMEEAGLTAESTNTIGDRMEITIGRKQ
ncbi:hypothetical protein MNBD_NITROSPINAE02-366 [hydrothermal vent metagenome]|uniref:O-methyltransferase C-terminal domain-containing protein n=1 Tax=hydrothermal vent metagenome TaxID=652676 RepID=A0A3B1CHM3_9ZZZZ